MPLLTILGSLLLVAGQNLAARVMELPSGAELLVDHLETSFSCPDRYGYFADEDHHCRIFHVCNPMPTEIQHFSFVCGNQTVFDQLNLACAHPDEAIPCEYSSYFSYVNERVGTDYNLHYESDIERAAPYVPNKLGTYLFDNGQSTEQRQPQLQPQQRASAADRERSEAVAQDFHQQRFEFSDAHDDASLPEAQPPAVGEVRSHQRQNTASGRGHDFTVLHPQSRQLQQEPSGLQVAISRRPRRKNSLFH